MPNLIHKVAGLACSWAWSGSCNGLTEQTIITGAAAALLAAGLAALACYAWWIMKCDKSKPPLPPGPRGLPILGNLPFLQPDLHQYFTKLSQIYGPIIKLQLGSKTCIVVNSASIAKEIVTDHDAVFANREAPITAIIGAYGGCGLIWRPNGPEWRKLRRLVAHEIMSNTGLDGCYALRRREVREMVKDVYGKAGSPVNIDDQVFITILNEVLSTLWGGSLHGEERNRLGIEFRKFAIEFIELIGAPNLSDLFPFLTRFDLQGYQSRMNKASAWFDDIFESVIANRRKFDQQPDGEHMSKDFLQLLLELNQKGDYKSSLSINEVKALLLDLVLAGTDATAIIVEWAMTELLRHPDEMRRAMEELDNVVGDQIIVEESHIPRLPYLDAVIKETLRLHPSAPLLVPRRPSMSCTVAGYSIPKDCRVLINAWAIQRDPTFWENPLQFEPQRFLKLDGEKLGNYVGNNFNFMPFGSGRRICVGIAMAERMVKHVLAALVHSFQWKVVPHGHGHRDGSKPADIDMKENFGLVLKKLEPLVAIPTPRLSNSELYTNN